MAKTQSGEVDIHRNAPAHWQQVTLGDYAVVAAVSAIKAP